MQAGPGMQEVPSRSLLVRFYLLVKIEPTFGAFSVFFSESRAGTTLVLSRPWSQHLAHCFACSGYSINIYGVIDWTRSVSLETEGKERMVSLRKWKNHGT